VSQDNDLVPQNNETLSQWLDLESQNIELVCRNIEFASQLMRNLLILTYISHNASEKIGYNDIMRTVLNILT